MNNEEKDKILIKFEDGNFSLDVNVSPDEDNVWLITKEIALLFELALLIAIKIEIFFSQKSMK